MKNLIICVAAILSPLLIIKSQELIIGEERIELGIVFIFEGAIKDKIEPSLMHLDEKQTNIHIEARVNWDVKNTPPGTPASGFIPYLHLTAELINNKTGLSTFIDLLPHINLIDNFHYARNISLPGKIDELYDVTFNILPPSNIELAVHKDWSDLYGNKLFESKSFTYQNINFEEIARATRR